MAISGNMSMIWKVTRNTTTGLIESKPYQNLTTRNAKKWTHFKIDHNQYLVVANLGNGERAEKSRVYRWDRRKRLFISFQAIWTRGAQSWEFFSIKQPDREIRDYFLIVANSGKVTTLQIFCCVWRRLSLVLHTPSLRYDWLTFLWSVCWLLTSAPNPSFHGGTMVKVSKWTTMSRLRQTRIRQILVVLLRLNNRVQITKYAHFQ